MSKSKIALTIPFVLAAITTAAAAGSLNDGSATPATVAPDPGLDWSGHYVGGFAGYGGGDYTQGVSQAGEVGVEVTVDGTFAGLRYGRNWQRSNLVFGFDVSISSGIDGITPQGTSGPFWVCGTGDCNISIHALAMGRGRLGRLVTPRTLVYGAAGLAVGDIGGGIYNSVQQGSSTAVGYTLGLGMEYRINEKISLYGEANYVDLGEIDFGEGSTPAETFDAKGDFSTVLVGVNYHF
ncbi:outer membrane beta-barrel protein [Roseovarius sp. SCSIO 43702]|uniref:outer membrane protein n=1 Tax=Roseovarius sp. SCSIO 43702 TaxID=2823043 RepID=UPI001C731247|nr:outer membrane beta-barrel protein [Roseovarius sp. SCSIO 43702]QYX55844.1 outer membrane beta-barrel protein [Roseovarius sp. SCSIO 43702]